MKDIENVRVLANKIMFDYKEEEVELAQLEFEEFLQLVSVFEEVDYENAQPLTFPYEVETTYLREDIADHVATLEQILRNANSVKEGQIKIDKVV